VPLLEKRCDLQQKRLIDKRREIRQLRCQLNDLEGKRDELKSKNGELSELMQNLRSKTAGLEGEIVELESKAMKLEERKDELEAEFLISSVDERTLLDDGAVRDRWAGLENTILNIAIERFGQPPDAGNQEPEEIFAGFVAEPRAWLQSGRREWLFQAFIWNALVERVFSEYGFSAHGYNLSGENRRVYSEYLRALRGQSATAHYLLPSSNQQDNSSTLELAAANRLPDECNKPGGITRLQYQKLKAAMNMILGPIKRLDTGRITKVAAEIEDELLPFQSPDADPDDCPSFEELIRDAVALDADMAKCRAWYQVSMYDFKHADEAAGQGEPQVEAFGMEFNGQMMQDALHGKGQKVSLVVSPLLLKWGDLDGKRFGNSIVLAPKGVITT